MPDKSTTDKDRKRAETQIRVAAAEMYDLLPLGVYERVIKRMAEAATTFASEVRAEQKIPSCAICGGGRVSIRGRFPRDPQREVCPTCVTERLEQIHEIASMEYGAAAAIRNEVEP